VVSAVGRKVSIGLGAPDGGPAKLVDRSRGMYREEPVVLGSLGRRSCDGSVVVYPLCSVGVVVEVLRYMCWSPAGVRWDAVSA